MQASVMLDKGCLDSAQNLSVFLFWYFRRACLEIPSCLMAFSTSALILSMFLAISSWFNSDCKVNTNLSILNQ